MTVEKIEKDKRQAVLQATLALVAEQGFHNTPMAQIARRAGVSAGIIYHYFAGKDELIHALYAEIKEAFSRSLLNNLAFDAPPVAQFQQLWRNAFTFYATHPHEAAFLDQYERSPYQSHGMHAAHAQTQQETQRLLQLVVQLQEAKIVRPLPLDVLYELTFGVATRIARLFPAGTPLDEELLEATAAACWRAIAT